MTASDATTGDWFCGNCGASQDEHITGERDGSLTHAWEPVFHGAVMTGDEATERALSEHEREALEQAARSTNLAVSDMQMQAVFITVEQVIAARAQAVALRELPDMREELAMAENDRDEWRRVAEALQTDLARAEQQVAAAMRELSDTSRSPDMRISRAMIALGPNGEALLAALAAPSTETTPGNDTAVDSQSSATNATDRRPSTLPADKT